MSRKADRRNWLHWGFQLAKHLQSLFSEGQCARAKSQILPQAPDTATLNSLWYKEVGYHLLCSPSPASNPVSQLLIIWGLLRIHERYLHPSLWLFYWGRGSQWGTKANVSGTGFGYRPSYGPRHLAVIKLSQVQWVLTGAFWSLLTSFHLRILAAIILQIEIRALKPCGHKAELHGCSWTTGMWRRARTAPFLGTPCLDARRREHIAASARVLWNPGYTLCN